MTILTKTKQRLHLRNHDGDDNNNNNNEINKKMKIVKRVNDKSFLFVRYYILSSSLIRTCLYMVVVSGA